MADDSAGEASTTPKKGVRSGIPAFLVATAVSAGIGVGTTYLVPLAKGDSDRVGTTGETGDVRRGVVQKPVVDLPPIITNLTAPRDVWIRLEASLLFTRPVERAEQVAAQFGTDVLAYLRTMNAEQIEGPVGLLNLREELNDRAATRSNGAAREVAIRALVVQ